MEADRERAYDGADRQPAQNLDAGYRSRWAVNAVGLGRREQRATPSARAAVSARGTGDETTVDLTPLMRLAQEACWNRLLNRPRRICQADL